MKAYPKRSLYRERLANGLGLSSDAGTRYGIAHWRWQTDAEDAVATRLSSRPCGERRIDYKLRAAGKKGAARGARRPNLLIRMGKPKHAVAVLLPFERRISHSGAILFTCWRYGAREGGTAGATRSMLTCKAIVRPGPISNTRRARRCEPALGARARWETKARIYEAAWSAQQSVQCFWEHEAYEPDAGFAGRLPILM